MWVESDCVTLNGAYMVSSFLGGLDLFVVDSIATICDFELSLPLSLSFLLSSTTFATIVPT